MQAERQERRTKRFVQQFKAFTSRNTPTPSVQVQIEQNSDIDVDVRERLLSPGQPTGAPLQSIVSLLSVHIHVRYHTVVHPARPVFAILCKVHVKHVHTQIPADATQDTDEISESGIRNGREPQGDNIARFLNLNHSTRSEEGLRKTRHRVGLIRLIFQVCCKIDIRVPVRLWPGCKRMRLLWLMTAAIRWHLRLCGTEATEAFEHTSTGHNQPY